MLKCKVLNTSIYLSLVEVTISCNLAVLIVESHDSKRVCPSVSLLVGQSVRHVSVSAGRDEPANDLFSVYELV